MRFTAAFLCIGFLVNVAISANAQTPNCTLDDVSFALDESTSITGANFFENIQTFTKKAARLLSNRAPGVKFSAVAFSTRPDDVQKPASSDLNEFNNNVDGHNPSGGGTRIDRGLNRCLGIVKNTGNRNQVIILVTDGNGGNFLPVCDTIKGLGITLVTVGIGNGINKDRLRACATAPEFFITVADTEMLVRNVFKVVNLACKRDECEDAFQKCKFTFQGQPTVPTYSIRGAPDVVFTDKIIARSDPQVGILNSNGPAPEFLTRRRFAPNEFRPITSFGNQPFTPTHFKPLSFTMKPLASGIGHQTFQGNQLRVARKRCVRVFFTQYQVIKLAPTPMVIDNVNSPTSDDNCVVFKTA